MCRWQFWKLTKCLEKLKQALKPLESHIRHTESDSAASGKVDTASKRNQNSCLQGFYESIVFFMIKIHAWNPKSWQALVPVSCSFVISHISVLHSTTWSCFHPVHTDSSSNSTALSSKNIVFFSPYSPNIYYCFRSTFNLFISGKLFKHQD